MRSKCQKRIRIGLNPLTVLRFSKQQNLFFGFGTVKTVFVRFLLNPAEQLVCCTKPNDFMLNPDYSALHSNRFVKNPNCSVGFHKNLDENFLCCASPKEQSSEERFSCWAKCRTSKRFSQIFILFWHFELVWMLLHSCGTFFLGVQCSLIKIWKFLE